ncbi:A/G-specific DNA-adenine glycosylase [Roseivirga pacifica]|uniref:Adenine DNA glycosylase n=1 Tax=Roseivirga pacifica TaxID=1267423 RepID=A0A1I0MEG8_9BACT|nr:A/G-specific adenine glycosylase [Roseivirga pacifica]RKQ50338.1 A/G-specific DNA-adenine glycosylase [Roseivirga pacifica]SEV86807.1 A/G-specific DNA-adenine glycosylase [Roseivirga pacifica]
MQAEVFVNQLIKWHQTQKRELPWRGIADPYKIWLSEIILQQTRVNQGLPYYLRFIAAYPTVQDLANASEAEVLRLWQGLGYYSRARNLHACAKMVVNEYNGSFPNNFDELLKLKGIGRYTAAAIASLAFNKANAVVDGNVYRVLSRVFGITNDISEAKTQKVFEAKANAMIPADQPGDFNQALMDFGATHCTPKKPLCITCPFQAECFAFNKGMIDQLPVKTKKVKVRKRYFYYLLFEHKGKLLMKERGPKDIWQGLNDFHLIEEKKPIAVESVLAKVDLQGITVGDISEPVKHILTHQQIFAQFIRLEVKEMNKFVALSNDLELKSFSLKAIHDLPKPVLVNNYLKENLF